MQIVVEDRLVDTGGFLHSCVDGSRVPATPYFDQPENKVLGTKYELEYITFMLHVTTKEQLINYHIMIIRAIYSDDLKDVLVEMATSEIHLDTREMITVTVICNNKYRYDILCSQVVNKTWVVVFKDLTIFVTELSYKEDLLNLVRLLAKGLYLDETLK
jgi:hypothetical protein